jgi:hypothetical protein
MVSDADITFLSVKTTKAAILKSFTINWHEAVVSSEQLCKDQSGKALSFLLGSCQGVDLVYEWK